MQPKTRPHLSGGRLATIEASVPAIGSTSEAQSPNSQIPTSSSSTHFDFVEYDRGRARVCSAGADGDPKTCGSSSSGPETLRNNLDFGPNLDHREGGDCTHSNGTGNTGENEPNGRKVEILWPILSCTHERIPEKVLAGGYSRAMRQADFSAGIRGRGYRHFAAIAM